MNQQIFIQTDSRVIDVSKIAAIDTAGTGDCIAYFIGQASLSLPRAEADALMVAMSRTRELICVRAQSQPEEKPSAKPALKSAKKRKEAK